MVSSILDILLTPSPSRDSSIVLLPFVFSIITSGFITETSWDKGVSTDGFALLIVLHAVGGKSISIANLFWDISTALVCLLFHLSFFCLRVTFTKGGGFINIFLGFRADGFRFRGLSGKTGIISKRKFGGSEWEVERLRSSLAKNPGKSSISISSVSLFFVLMLFVTGIVTKLCEGGVATENAHPSGQNGPRTISLKLLRTVRAH